MKFPAQKSSIRLGSRELKKEHLPAEPYIKRRRLCEMISAVTYLSDEGLETRARGWEGAVWRGL